MVEYRIKIKIKIIVISTIIARKLLFALLITMYVLCMLKNSSTYKQLQHYICY